MRHELLFGKSPESGISPESTYINNQSSICKCSAYTSSSSAYLSVRMKAADRGNVGMSPGLVKAQ